MTLDDILTKIHIIYEGDTTYPSSGEEDYEVRLQMINDAIDEWAYLENTYWKELFTNLSDAATGDKTATASDNEYDAPSDFRFISSFLYITDTNNIKHYYKYIKQDEVINYQAEYPSGKAFYITGKPTAYKINILNPVAGTINYSYYKTPSHLSSSTDVPEMSNPLFIVYSVVAKLYELDNRNDLVSKYIQMANNALNQMIIENETAPFLHSTSNTELFDYNFGI